jgi:type 1 fimbria pilin
MKKLKLTLALLAAVAVTSLTNTVFADDTKDVTITGTMVCGKCSLHLTEKCQNVVQVMDGTNTVNYFLKQNEVSKAQHESVCHGDSEKVTITGTVKEKDGKKILTASKIEVQK